MKVTLDIRAHEDWAQRAFGNSLGQAMRLAPRTGNKEHDNECDRLFPALTRRILIDVTDPMFAVVKERIFKDNGTVHYSQIVINRSYTHIEIANAELLQLLFTRMFEPCGEDCGTVYNDSDACPKCGYGRMQRSPLRLNLNKVPKNVDFAFTIARDEWIVSERLAELMSRRRVLSAEEFSGYRLDPVEHVGRKPCVQKWFQLIVTGRAGHTAAGSRFAIDYLRDDPEGRFVCTEHGLSGLNLVSEVYLHRSDVEVVDMAVTSDREGLRSGVLMPMPILVISPRFYRLLEEHKIKGYKVEVAHLVD